jgi:hypothetical protein
VGAVPRRKADKESTSFLKKRSKKLLIISASVLQGERSRIRKVLLFFFKNEGLSCR